LIQLRPFSPTYTVTLCWIVIRLGPSCKPGVLLHQRWWSGSIHIITACLWTVGRQDLRYTAKHSILKCLDQTFQGSTSYEKSRVFIPLSGQSKGFLYPFLNNRGVQKSMVYYTVYHINLATHYLCNLCACEYV